MSTYESSHKFSLPSNVFILIYYNPFLNLHLFFAYFHLLYSSALANFNYLYRFLNNPLFSSGNKFFLLHLLTIYF